MSRDLFVHAFDVCRVHRALYNARHGRGDLSEVEAQAAVDAEYVSFDFPSIVRHVEWAGLNLIETENAHYGSPEERNQEVGIATSIRDKAVAIRNEVVTAVAGPQEGKETLTAADIADCTPTRALPADEMAEGDAV